MTGKGRGVLNSCLEVFSFLFLWGEGGGGLFTKTELGLAAF